MTVSGGESELAVSSTSPQAFIQHSGKASTSYHSGKRRSVGEDRHESTVEAEVMERQLPGGGHEADVGKGGKNKEAAEQDLFVDGSLWAEGGMVGVRPF